MLEKYCKTVKYDALASDYTTFGIGGRVKAVAFPKSEEEFIDTIKYLSKTGENWSVIGRGSNILVSDKGYDGTLVTTRRLCDLTREGEFFEASCGIALPALSKHALFCKLSGAEFLIGIPGSLGGAVRMNAGAHGEDISDILSSVKIFDGEVVKEYKKEELDLSYRHSNIEKLGTILSAKIKLFPSNPKDIEAKMSDFVEKRAKSQPKDKSAGCIFKSVQGVSAGRLADELGLKGVSVGGAEVAKAHAGFIVNRGGATASDVVALMFCVKDRVRESYGVELESEICFLGEFDEDIRRLSHSYDL